MMTILNPPTATLSPEAKSLAAVILPCNVSTIACDTSDDKDAANNGNLWTRITY